MTRVNALLKREIGAMLFHIMHESDFDLAAVTVTRVVTARNLRSAAVHVSIRDHTPERSRMLSLLARHAPEIQQRINRNIGLKYTPRLSFELDTSIEEGDKLLRLLDDLEKENSG